MAEFIPGFDNKDAKKIEPLDITEIKRFLEQEIKGQDEAVEAWARILQRALIGTPKLRKGPLAVITEIGPSGVGKTEIAIQAARFLASQSQSGQRLTSTEKPSVLRIDCGEYAREHEVAKLLGSPPGYIGHGETPRLAQSEIDQHAIAVDNRRKVTVLIFDEIEKAHEKLSVSLLAALDYGVMTMGNGQKTSLDNCIIVFTSNLGNKKVIDAKGEKGTLTPAETKKIHIDAMLEHFTPEQLSRMGGDNNTVCFNELSREVVQGILLSKLNKLEKLYAEFGMNFSFQVTPGGLKNLLDLSFSPREGVRRLENVLEQRVSSRLAGVGRFEGMLPVVIDAENGDDVALYIPKQQPVITEVSTLPPSSTPPNPSSPSSPMPKTPVASPKLEPAPQSKINIPTLTPIKPPAPSSQESVPQINREAIFDEIKRNFRYSSVQAGVNLANEYVRKGLIQRESALAVFLSQDMQNHMIDTIKRDFRYSSPQTAVNQANEYLRLGVMTQESVAEVFASADMQNHMIDTIKRDFRYSSPQTAVNTANNYRNLNIMTQERIKEVFYSNDMQNLIIDNIKRDFRYSSPQVAGNTANEYIRLGIMTKETASKLLADLDKK